MSRIWEWREDTAAALWEEARALLEAGRLLALPTETYYALAAHPFRDDALARLFELKERSKDKLILLLVAEPGMLARVARDIPPGAGTLMERFWPGPLGGMVDRKRIALVGYGNVGKVLVDMLAQVDPEGKRFVFSAICSRSIGVANLKDLAPEKVERKLKGNKGDAKAYNPEERVREIKAYLKESDYDMLVETTAADYETGEPALSYIITALDRGIDDVTCNKGPIALHLMELQQAASRSNASLKFEHGDGRHSGLLPVQEPAPS